MEKRKKESEKTEEIINELVEKYREQLQEIFSKNTFEFTFDEREKLIDWKIDVARREIIESHIKKDREISKKDNKVSETCTCVCGTEAILCRVEEGKEKLFEREIQTKRGSVEIKEYGYYCTKCRKVFFPSKKKTKAVQGKLQSGPSA